MWKDDLVTSIVASKKLAEIQTTIRVDRSEGGGLGMVAVVE